MDSDNPDMEILPSSRQHGTFSADGIGFYSDIIGMTIGRDRGDGNVDKTLQAGWKLVYSLHNGKIQRFRRSAQKTSIVLKQIRVKDMQSGGNMNDMSQQNFASLLKWCANTKDLAKVNVEL